MKAEILELLAEKHPRSRKELHGAIKQMALDFGGIEPTEDEYNEALQELFNGRKIVFTNEPSGPISLDSKPVEISLDWVDLHAEGQ